MIKKVCKWTDQQIAAMGVTGKMECAVCAVVSVIFFIQLSGNEQGGCRDSALQQQQPTQHLTELR